MSAQIPTTRHTLVERLADRHHPLWQEAWAEFVRLYGPHLLRWSIRWAGRTEMAHDVSAELLSGLARAIPRYRRIGRFRSWLYTVCRREKDKVLKQKKWKPLATTGDAVDQLSSPAAHEDLRIELREPVKKTVIDQAFTYVRQRLERTGSLRTWDGYWLTAPCEGGGQGLSYDAAARVLFPELSGGGGTSDEQSRALRRALQNVRQYRRRVRDMLFEELELLGEDVSKLRAAKRGRPRRCANDDSRNPDSQSSD